MDPDQRSCLIWVHTVCKNDLKSQADDKADDNCCDWHLRVKNKGADTSFGQKGILIVFIRTACGI